MTVLDDVIFISKLVHMAQSGYLEKPLCWACK